MNENHEGNNPELNNINPEQNNIGENNQVPNEEINQNKEENLNKEEVKEESNFRLILYIILIIVIFLIVLFLLRACNGIRNKNTSKITETNAWVANMWNKCVDPVYWYTVDGTGVNGADINIDSVLNDCDTYYNEYKSKKSEIVALSDEYSDFKEYYNKISEQMEIIYPKIKANKPVAKETVDYEDNMEIFYDYQVKLYNLVKEKYSEK